MRKVCVGVMYSGEYDVCDVTLECASTLGKLKRYYTLVSQRVAGSIPTVAKLTFQLARCGCTLRVTSQTSWGKCWALMEHVVKVIEDRNGEGGGWMWGWGGGAFSLGPVWAWAKQVPHKYLRMGPYVTRHPIGFGLHFIWKVSCANILDVWNVVCTDEKLHF